MSRQKSPIRQTSSRTKQQSHPHKINTPAANAPTVHQQTTINPTDLTPAVVQRLQASHGNHFVSRLLEQQAADSPTPNQPAIVQETTAAAAQRDPVLQRLGMSEHPIQTDNPPLKNIKDISGGGTGGVTALVENEQGHKLVAKTVYASSKPENAVAASQILMGSGVITPNVRIASGDDRNALMGGLQTLRTTTPENLAFIDKFLNQMTTKNYPVLLMDYVKGQTLSSMEGETSIVDVFNDLNFQRELGKILATDSFYGETDRMHVIENDTLTNAKDRKKYELSYNPGNLMIIKTTEGYHAVPIDNDFDPEVNAKKTGMPFATQNKQSSLTVAHSVDAFATEAASIYEVFVKLEKKPGGLKALFGTSNWKKKKEQWEANKTYFVSNVVQSGRETLDRLMKRGQNWGDQLSDVGVGEEQIKNFRERKRFIRLLRAGLERNKAIKLSRDQKKYRRWRLIYELGFTPKKADAVIRWGEKTYKRSVKATIKMGKPVMIPPAKKWKRKKT